MWYVNTYQGLVIGKLNTRHFKTLKSIFWFVRYSDSAVSKICFSRICKAKSLNSTYWCTENFPGHIASDIFLGKSLRISSAEANCLMKVGWGHNRFSLSSVITDGTGLTRTSPENWNKNLTELRNILGLFQHWA